jgi:hypothetical protein
MITCRRSAGACSVKNGAPDELDGLLGISLLGPVYRNTLLQPQGEDDSATEYLAAEDKMTPQQEKMKACNA